MSKKQSGAKKIKPIKKAIKLCLNNERKRTLVKTFLPIVWRCKHLRRAINHSCTEWQKKTQMWIWHPLAALIPSSMEDIWTCWIVWFFLNENIVNFHAKHLIKNFPCPNNFLYLNSLLINNFEPGGDLNNVNLGMETQNITFAPINAISLHW